MKRAVLLLALIGCKSEKLPTCTEITDHVLELTQKMYPGHGDMGQHGNRKLMIEQCDARKLTGEERKCIMAAKSTDAVAMCRRDTMKKEEAGSGSAPAPK